MLNILKALFSDHIYLISIVAIIFLTYTIVVPLWQMISNTLLWTEGDQVLYPEAEAGKVTLQHWITMLTGDVSKNIFYKPIMRSLNVGIWVSFIAMVMGGTLAWIVTRTDIPYKKTLTF